MASLLISDKVLETVTWNFKSANDSISNVLDVYKDSLDEFLLKVQDREERATMKAEFNVLKRSITKANEKLKSNTISAVTKNDPIQCKIDLCNNEFGIIIHAAIL